jgi:hypothetical protein
MAESAQQSAGTAKAQPASSSKIATTAGDNTNRSDVNHNQGAQAAQPLTTSQVYADVPAAPEVKASTTPMAESAQQSAGTAKAQPASSSKIATTAGDNTNRSDVNHNQGAQTEVRTVEAQTQVNTVETQHHTNTVTQQFGGASPKAGGGNQARNATANKGDKPDVS